MSNRTIGLLGLGDQSTNFYTKQLSVNYDPKTRNDGMPFLKLAPTNFNEINDLLPVPSKKLDRIIKRYLYELISLNVDLILIPNITLHETIDRLKLKIKMVHPVHSIVHKIKKEYQKSFYLVLRTR